MRFQDLLEHSNPVLKKEKQHETIACFDALRGNAGLLAGRL